MSISASLIKSFIPGNRMVVLTYHRVLDKPDYMYPNEPDVLVFKKQLAWLKSCFDLVTLDEGLKRIESSVERRPMVAITFDDGYADNWKNALPLLTEFDIPASFFLVTENIGNGLMWNDLITELCRNTKEAHTQLEIEGRTYEFDFTCKENRFLSSQRLITSLKYVSRLERRTCLKRLQENLALPEFSGPELMMSKEHVHDLRAKGMTIGAHAKSHEILTTLSREDALTEIRDSKSNLEKLIGASVEYYAYPNGKYHKDFIGDHIEMVKNAGYSHAFSTNWASCSNVANPYCLPRIMPWRKTKFGFISNILQAFNLIEFDGAESKRILQIAFDFPPCQSAGVQRTLKYTEQLPEYGWNPVVLTANKRSYSATDDSQSISALTKVYRAWGLDASRHLSFKGKYLGFTTIPDRYSSWILPAIFKGLYAIKKQKPSVIWSTYPIPSSHFIGYVLSKCSGLPWVADYRDPAPFHYTNSNKNNFFHRWIDKLTAKNASLMVFATGSMRELYLSKYPSLMRGNTYTIENGFNETVFDKFFNEVQLSPKKEYVILHSGALYNNGRSPVPLFRAIGRLKKSNPETIESFVVRFRGANITDEYQRVIEEEQIQDQIDFAESIPYYDSIQEMLRANCLLLIQGSTFNYQIPGKAYEYIGSQNPILAMCGKGGATGELLKGIPDCVVTEESNVTQLIEAINRVKKFTVSKRQIKRYGRRDRTMQLAKILDGIVWHSKL